MNQFTQMELLEEGFWDMFKLHKSPILKGIGKAAVAAGTAAKHAIKGGLAVGKFAAEKLAPEIYDPIKNTVDQIKELNKRVIKASTPEATYIQQKLQGQGYMLTADIGKLRKVAGENRNLYMVRVVIRPDFVAPGQDNKEKVLVVDNEGGIVRDLTAPDAARSKPKTPKKNKKPKTVISPPQQPNIP